MKINKVSFRERQRETEIKISDEIKISNNQ